MKTYEAPRLAVVRLMNNDIVATDMVISETVPTVPPTTGGPGSGEFQGGSGTEVDGPDFGLGQ